MPVIPLAYRKWNTGVDVNTIGKALSDSHTVRRCQVETASGVSNEIGSISFRSRSIGRMPTPVFQVRMIRAGHEKYSLNVAIGVALADAVAIILVIVMLAGLLRNIPATSVSLVLVLCAPAFLWLPVIFYRRAIDGLQELRMAAPASVSSTEESGNGTLSHFH